MGLLVLLVVLAGFAFLIARSRRERDARRAAAETVALVADDWGVKRTLADGRYEEVAWSELREVRVLTLPRGPWDDRRRVILDGGDERGCIVPFDLATEQGVVAGLGRLPGFDYRKLAQLEETGGRLGNVVVWARG